MARPGYYSPTALWQRALALPFDLLHQYKRSSKKTKTAHFALELTSPRIIAGLHIFVLLLVIIITPTRIGQWFNALAIKIKGMGVPGMFLCGLFVVLASHPPLFGFAGSMTLIGFTYGIWPGFLIAGLASMLGAGFAFVSIRTFFLTWIRKQSNPKWDAFSRVMDNKGLPLIIMIRYCPLPWAIGNGLFASVESVKLWQFMLANFVMQPRLLIPVFIGSRLTSLTHESPSSDPVQFWVNIISILLTGTVSFVTGVWIYRLTLEQMKQLEREGGDDLAADALEAGALLGDYSDEGEGEDEPLTVRAPRGTRSGLTVGGGGGGALRRTSSSGEST